MYQSLGSVTLKSGEAVEAGVVRAPDEEWRERLQQLLAHKPGVYLWQVEELLHRDVGVEALFHVLHRDGQIFSQTLTVEVGGVGILGHVWTVPEDRGQGAASQLLHRLLDHFRDRNGKAMYLGTGFGTSPFRIYEKCGFAGIEPRSGVMALFTEPQLQFEQEYFRGGETVIEPITWSHWPTSAVLFAADLPGVVRNVQYGLLGRGLTEGPLLKALHNQQTRRNEEAPETLVLKKLENNGVVGVASWGWHPLWPETCLVDLYCHPEYWNSADALLAQLSLPAAHQTIAFCETGFDAKLEVLKATGFQPVSVLPKWVEADVARTDYLDVQLLVKQ